MAEPGTVTVPPSPRRMLGLLAGGSLGVVVAAVALSLAFCGLGPATAWASAAGVGLGAALCGVAAARGRPRVVITPRGFTVHKVFGSESRDWGEIDDEFAAVRVGWAEAVGYNLTPAAKARAGGAAPRFGGYDAAILGPYRLPAGELAGLLNEHKRRHWRPPAPDAAGQEGGP
jgi:hypothetical protein